VAALLPWVRQIQVAFAGRKTCRSVEREGPAEVGSAVICLSSWFEKQVCMATSSPSHDHGPDQLSLAQAPPLLGGAAALRSELNTSQQLQSPTLNVTQASVSPEPGSSPRGLARAGSSSSGDSIIEWPIRRSLRKSEGGSIHRTPPRTVDASIVSTSSHLSHTSVIEEAFRSLADPEPSPPGPMLPKPSPSQAQIEPPGWSDGGRGNAREPQLADRLAPAEKHSEAWVVEAHEAAAGVGLKANSVDDSEKEEDLRNIFTQGAADCKVICVWAQLRKKPFRLMYSCYAY